MEWNRFQSIELSFQIQEQLDTSENGCALGGILDKDHPPSINSKIRKPKEIIEIYPRRKFFQKRL